MHVAGSLVADLSPNNCRYTQFSMTLNNTKRGCFHDGDDDELFVAQSGGIPLGPTAVAEAFESDDFWVIPDDAAAPPCCHGSGLTSAYNQYAPCAVNTGSVDSQDMEPIKLHVQLESEADSLSLSFPNHPSFPCRSQRDGRSLKVQPVVPSRKACHHRSVPSTIYATNVNREKDAPPAPIAERSLDVMKRSAGPSSSPTAGKIAKLDAGDRDKTTVPGQPRSASQFFCRYQLEHLRQQGFQMAEDSSFSVPDESRRAFHRWCLAESMESLGFHVSSDPFHDKTRNKSDEQRHLQHSVAHAGNHKRDHSDSKMRISGRRTRSQISCGTGTAKLAQHIAQSWYALPDGAKNVFREMARQDEQRYRQEIAEGILAGTLPLFMAQEPGSKPILGEDT
jgi:hypothetical protein